ncbi:MAG: hypothetical protein CBC65_003290 [Rhodothermaceae bacterium TMED105]|nr:MAG: hypothetical protein CBC65_003290 [Rhodothermaceae bacterium TMED105]
MMRSLWLWGAAFTLFTIGNPLSTYSQSHNSGVSSDISVESLLTLNNIERKSVYRPLSEKPFLWPATYLTWSVTKGHFIANANVRFDLYYDRDPDGFDAVNRLYMRNDESYIGFQNEWAQVLVGRKQYHWGLPGQNALFLSDNARTFDQLAMAFDFGSFSYDLVLGQLDDLSSDGRFGQDTRNDPGAKRRFVSLKRFTWRPNDNLTLSYKEAILYSGTNANWSPRYMVPTSLYVFLADNAPRNDQINLLFGGSILWTPGNWLAYSELMIDDIIFNRKERGITETGMGAWLGHLSWTDETTHIQWHSEAIGYQAYNTDQAEGRYLYLGRGLATQFNDYVFTEIRAVKSLQGVQGDYHGDHSDKKRATHQNGTKIQNAILGASLGFLWQGEQTINQPFTSAYPDGSRFERVLTGDVERTIRAAIQFGLETQSKSAVELGIGYNWVQNPGHQRGESSGRWAGSIIVRQGFSFSSNSTQP